MSSVIVVANEKGGVAKTTTALSLGAALAEREQEVLVVDLDPQANLTLGLGIRPGNLQLTIADVLVGSAEIRGVRRQTAVRHLDLVPANHQLMTSERFLEVQNDYDLVLRQALEQVDEYRVILMDCPPALGTTTRCALAAADLLIIPTQCEFFSASALREVLTLVRQVRSTSNPGLRYRLLITMLDRRNRIHNTLLGQIRATFGSAVFDTVIEVDTRLRESPILGQPITVYAPTSRGSEQYRSLAKELSRHEQEIVRSPS